MGWERRAARVILLVHLALSPLIFSPLSADVFEYPKVMLLRTAAILLLGLGASWFAGQVFTRRMSWERSRDSLRRDPIAWGVLAFLISAGISTAFSLSPRTSLIGAHESFLGLFHLLAWAVLFFATRAAITGFGEARWLLWAMVVASLGACTYALLQLAGFDPIAWTRTSPFRGYTRIFGTMGHPILLAGFLVTAFPVCAYLALSAWRRGRLVGAGWAAAAVLLCWAVILASFSRGAWLALGIALCSLLVGWWRVGERLGVRVLLGGAIVGFVLSGVGFFALVGDTSALTERVFARAGSLLNPGQEPRLQIWRAAWQMFMNHPLSGVGVDTFQLAFQQFRPATYWLVQGEWGGTPTRAHNEVLHFAATQGTLGLAAIALLIGGFVLAWPRALRAAGSLEQEELLVALGVGMIGFGAQSMFSFSVAGTATLFVTYAALLSRFSRITPEPGRSSAAAGRAGMLPGILARFAILIAVLLGLLYGVLNPLRANTSFQKGRVLGLQGKHAAALPHITRALERDGEQPLYWLELCAAHHAAGTGEAVHAATRNQDAALSDVRAPVRRHPPRDHGSDRDRRG